MYYIYRIVNNISGKTYIGQRKYNRDPKNDKYMGSGKVLKQAYEKYGKVNFTKTILCKDVETHQQINELELYYIRHEKNMVKQGILPGCYNILEGAHWEKDHEPWNKGKKLGPNPEHSARMKGRPSWNKGEHTGHVPWNKGLTLGPITGEEYERRYGNRVYDHEKLSKAHKGQKSSMKGKKLSKERCQQMSDYNKAHGIVPPSNKGKHWYTNGIKNVMALDCPEGFRPGKIHNIDSSINLRKE